MRSDEKSRRTGSSGGIIIELKYLGNEKVKDSYVYNELMMRRDNFYENKKVAIRLIATALGII